MKKFIFLGLIISISGFFLSCSKSIPPKTSDNLTKAYNELSTASIKYSKFSTKAKEEGYNTISKIFQACSKSQAIQAEIFKKQLESNDIILDKPKIAAIEVRTTKENLVDGIQGVSFDITTIYPDYIKTAEAENAKDIINNFKQTIEIAKIQKTNFQIAINLLLNGMPDQTLPAKWFVCPNCGSIYNETLIKPNCDICKQSKDKYIAF